MRPSKYLRVCQVIRINQPWVKFKWWTVSSTTTTTRPSCSRDWKSLSNGYFSHNSATTSTSSGVGRLAMVCNQKVKFRKIPLETKKGTWKVGLPTVVYVLCTYACATTAIYCYIIYM